jgi:hypothetical protein
MGKSKHAPHRIHQKNRATIGRVNTEAHPFAGRHEAVHRGEKTGAAILNHRDIGPVDLLGDTEDVPTKAEFGP